MDWRRTAEMNARTSSYRRRLDEAASAIAAMAELAGDDWFVSSSWGKDSTVVAGLALEHLGAAAKVFHMRSPYALPGDETVVAWFAERCAVMEEPYRKTLLEYIAWLKEVGLGYERESVGVGGRQKSELAVTWAQQHGFRGFAMGLRAEESAIRRCVVGGRGLVYRRADGMAVCLPIGKWKAIDVWTYIYERGLPYHKMYDFETLGYDRFSLRNGGWLTTLDPGRVVWLRTHYPAQYAMLVEAFPRVDAF